MQGLLHHQVLQLVLSHSSIEIRTTPLEATSIKTGGRKRNPQVIKLARRGMNRHHSHRKSSCLLSANDQIPSAIPSISPAVHSVLKRTDSDKRRKNSSLFRRLSSKRASADVQQFQFLSTSSCLTNDSTLPANAITPSKSFQYLSSKDETPSKSDSTDSGTVKNISANSTPLNTRTTANLTTHPLHHQCSISDSGSQSSSPNSSVPNSPATLTCNLSTCSNCSNVSTPLPSKMQQQSIAAAQFNRPNTLHGLKYKLVQTFRSPNNRRKSCGSVITTIPLSPLARNDRTSSPSCATCLAHHQQQQQPNASPTRSPSPLAFANNGQPINHRHSHHFHRHRHSQLNCTLQSSSPCSNNCLNKQLAHHTASVMNENASSADLNTNTSLSSNTATNPKKSICSSHCLSNRHVCHSNINDLDLYSPSIEKSSGTSYFESKFIKFNYI